MDRFPQASGSVHAPARPRLFREHAPRNLCAASVCDCQSARVQGLRRHHLGHYGERRSGGHGARPGNHGAPVSDLCCPRRRREGYLRRLHASADRCRCVVAVCAGIGHSRGARYEQALRAVHLFAIRLLRCVQSQFRLRRAYSPRPPHSRVWVGGRRLSGHRSGRDFRDDRKLSQRDDLGRDAQEPVRAPRPDACRFRRWLADRVRAVSRRRPTSSFRASIALCTALLLVCGCTSRSDDPNVVRFWAMGREGEVVTELLPEFERTHPGIHVEVQQLPWSAAHEKLLTAFAGDSTPDLCQLGNTWVPEFVALNALAPLDANAAASSVVDPRDYFAGIWDTNRVGGKLYGVPWYVDTRLIFFRRDLLARAGYAAPPRSWSEWTAMLEAIRQQRITAHYGIVLPASEFEPLVAFALQQDDPLLRDDGRFGNFESAGFTRALKFYVEMFRRGYAPPSTNADVSNVWNEFGRGYFTFYISGPWNIGELERRLPQALQQTWLTAPLPGPEGAGASIAGGSSLVLFQQSPSQAAAWQLIEYLSQPAIQRRLPALTGHLPPARR